MRPTSFTLGLVVALACTASAAFAHSFSQASLQLTFAGATADAQWRISLRDLDVLLGLDADHDQRVSSSELARSEAALSSYLLDRLELHADGAACTLQAQPSAAVGDYLHFNFRAQCPAAPQRLAVRYDLFFDHDPSHSSQVIVGASTTLVRADARVVDLVIGKANLWQQTLAYLEQGVWHIWTGYDHILFLCTLLLPVLFTRRRSDKPLLEVLEIVSAFTLAHSITLSLAALQVVALPTRWVEATIAASVCWAALNNIYHWVTHKIWLVVFGFGLVHGFGFASVLHELGLPSTHLLAALVAFNAGVELGQLAIVLAVLPLSLALRRLRWDSPLVLRTGSLVIAAVGGMWLLERALDTSLPRALGQLTRSADQAELSELLHSA
ncbi:MAG TPA: HupE/UreJ family protein, partial [Polyangiales bacterium]|nr:HupE/UreJ family protein [Polyangiales bacterium]